MSNTTTEIPTGLPPLPTPPEGFRWEYKGKAWEYSGEDAWLCFSEAMHDSAGWIRCCGPTSSLPSYHYMQAIPAAPTEPEYSSKEYQKTVLDAAWDGVPCQHYREGSDWRDLEKYYNVAIALENGSRIRIKPQEPAKQRIPLMGDSMALARIADLSMFFADGLTDKQIANKYCPESLVELIRWKLLKKN